MRVRCPSPIRVFAIFLATFGATHTVANPHSLPNTASLFDPAGSSILLAQESADDLFLPEEEEEVTAPPAGDSTNAESSDADSPVPEATAQEETAESTDDLFGDEPAEPVATALRSAPRFSGFIQNELAYTYADPNHFSKFRTLAKLRLSGSISRRLKWQLGGSFFYNPVFEFEDFYPDRVEDDQKLDGWIDESFLDIDADAWEFRIGRQHIIWGEMVGLFFADVISALDLREFVLPDFDLIRIPQWAARAEYFSGNFHADLVYIPVVTKDNIGEVGNDYRPFPAGIPLEISAVFLEDKALNDAAEDFGVGARASYIANGWDLAAFYYTSPDKTAALDRRLTLVGGVPTLFFKPVHERIHQIGGTLAKDYGTFVLKSEAIQTLDRLIGVSRLTDVDGLVETDELRYVVGIDWAGGAGHNVNLQFFQTWFQNHDRDMPVKELESGASILLTTTSLHPDFTPEVLWIRSLDRNDWLLETKLTWDFAQNWRAVLGADIFEGRANRLFGQFDASDRVYYELRFSF